MKTSVKANLNRLEDQTNEHLQKYVVTLLLTIEQNIVLNLNLKILDIDDLNHEDASIFHHFNHFKNHCNRINTSSKKLMSKINSCILYIMTFL